ncbi:hypothetical protein HFP89_10340 [Wenzhouxiangella sp. XN79A]|uniref:hypothetical protein n=1 Tax=Wenzhouxiangella sp. XN79A TaxID=2724193 RepID=UPI00144AEC94|nr:hypothetical protein [Wenzhouxiangella sp. XN79A]NKI35563.1 hypothetical protein [Wenzhouxiangella sp. XN79A]
MQRQQGARSEPSDMVLEFIRRHHLLGALLLAPATVLYAVGPGLSVLIVAAVALGLTDWVLLLSASGRRDPEP